MVRRFGYPIGYFVALAAFWVNMGHVNGQGRTTLPDFSFAGIDGDLVANERFDNGRPLVIFYFDPTCSHCRQQAEWVAREIEKFEGMDLLWVAWEPNPEINDFASRYFLQQQTVVFAIDQAAEFDTLFGFSEIPTIYVYNAANELVRKFKRETKVDKLLKPLGH